MSDPFLPEPPESEEDQAEREIQDVEDQADADVLTGPADEESGPSERDAGAFRTPSAGDRLSAEDLERDLD